MIDRPTALLLDDGELEDVDLLLRELEVDRIRLGANDRPASWPWPVRLLATTPQRAPSLELPPVGERGFATIVFHPGESTLPPPPGSPIGFDYLVRRPVHPEALRLLLLRALYRGHEQRAEPRLPVGTRVTWVSGLRPGRGTLLEISRRGCRLLASRGLAKGSRIVIHLPRELVGGVGLVLRGRIVRGGETAPGPSSESTLLAVEFEPSGLLVRNRIGGLLRELAIGPPPLRPEEVPAEAAPAVTPAPAAATPPKPAAPAAVHRQQRRSPVRLEVLAVDERAERVIHVFVGRDLSTGGLRVESHPAIALGDALRLAIYSAACNEPLLVDADVVRDDGELGFGLRFRDVAPAVAQRLESVVTSVSAEVLETGDPEPRGVLVAEILSGLSSLGDVTAASRIHAVKPPPDLPAPQLDKLEAAVLDLAQVGCTVQRVFDVIPESPIGIVRALESLLESERIRIDR
jgi:hypothetical protein